MAVAGKVLRPGILELPEGPAGLAIAEILELAGGTIRPQGVRVSHRTFDQAGREMVRDAVDLRAETMSAGDMVVVNFGENIAVGTVRLEGHVRLPGRRAFASAPTVHALIGGPDSLMEGAYLPFAVLETTDPATLARRLFAIDLSRILAGQQDFALREDDRLVVLGVDDIRFLSSGQVQQAISEVGDLQQAQPVLAAAQETIQQLTVDLEDANRRLALAAEGADVDLEAANRRLALASEGADVDLLLEIEPELQVCRGLDTLRTILAYPVYTHTH